MVVGLGNPGPDYENTRHNAGFWFVDHWAGTLGLPLRKAWFRPFLWAQTVQDGHRLVFVRPLTFMNRSGSVLPSLLKALGASPDDLLVVFDQMDLSPGRVRLKPHGSSAGHNGLKSIDAALGHHQYHRLAVGIGRPEGPMSIIDHVLGPPSAADRVAIDASIARAVERTASVWNRGWEPLINALNQRDVDRS